MDWMERIREVLRLDEEELALWRDIAAEEVNPHVRAIIRAMVERERMEMEDLRMLLRRGDYERDPEDF